MSVVCKAAQRRNIWERIKWASSRNEGILAVLGQGWAQDSWLAERQSPLKFHFCHGQQTSPYIFLDCFIIQAHKFIKCTFILSENFLDA